MAMPVTAGTSPARSNPNALFAWVAAAAFAAAAAWPRVSRQPFVLRGLRNLSDAPGLGWTLAAVSLALALFLTLGRLHTRGRLRACAFLSLALGVFVFAAASMVAAPLFLLLGVSLLREQRAAGGDGARSR